MLPISVVMGTPSAACRRKTNWPVYMAALRRWGSPLVRVDREMEWLAPKLGRPGRPQIVSDAAIQACLSIEVLFGLALRQIEPFPRHWSEPNGKAGWWGAC